MDDNDGDDDDPWRRLDEQDSHGMLPSVSTQSTDHYMYRYRYLACHGPDGTLLTRPPGLGRPSLASHSLSELQSLLRLYGTTINDGDDVGHPSPLRPSSFQSQLLSPSSEIVWDGTPIRLDPFVSTPSKAFQVARRLVASELWQILVSSQHSIDDLVQQLKAEMVREGGRRRLDGSGGGETDLSRSSSSQSSWANLQKAIAAASTGNDDDASPWVAPLKGNTTVTWNLRAHTWLRRPSSSSPSSSSSSSGMKHAIPAIRQILHQILSDKTREEITTNMLATEMSTDMSTSSAPLPHHDNNNNNNSSTITTSRHQDDDDNDDGQRRQSHRPVVYEKFATKAQCRFAVLQYHDNDKGGTPSSIQYVLAVQVGGGTVADACAAYEEGARRSALSVGNNNGNDYDSSGDNAVVVRSTSASASTFLTPTRPSLSLLMSNLACISKGGIVLDPFCGSGAMLWGAVHSQAALCLGSDLFVTAAIVPKRTTSSLYSSSLSPSSASLPSSTPSLSLSSIATVNDFMVCDVFALPRVLGGEDWSSMPLLDAIVTDPPYGLREDQTAVGRDHNDDDGVDVDEDGKGMATTQLQSPSPIPLLDAHSNCFIGDWSGQQLLDAVSFMMRPVIRLAAMRLRLGGRLVFLLPIFPSQADMGLWDDSRGGSIPNEALQRYLIPALMPREDMTTTDKDQSTVRRNEPQSVLTIVSAERHRCKRRGMARAVVVMEKI